MVAEYKVLLTASGTGSRLGNITKFTNKSLVRVGKKPCISYIVEEYNPSIEIVVTLGYYGKHVRDFLELAYPERKFTFVTVDKYEGEGSSLLYSMLQAKEHLQCPFIFHACDTITNKIGTPDRNWMAGYVDGDSSQYRSVNIRDGKVITLNEKGEQNTDLYYMGVCGIKDYGIFWDLASKIVDCNPKDQSLSDCHVLREMISLGQVFSETMERWIDIGNMKSLAIAREIIEDTFHILDKDEESIFLFKDFVIKFFHDTTLCKNRVARATVLGDKVPRILDSRDNFYKYEFAEGELVSRKATPKIMRSLIEWSLKNLWVPGKIQKDNFHDICHNFYINKTEKRIQSFLKTNNITDTTDTINSISVPPVSELLEKAKPIVMRALASTGFHGDFILDNILINDNKFILLDWRQDFGGEIEFGDMYYDICKLNHNLILNHDILNKNLFTINVGKTIECDILRSNNLVECSETLTEICHEMGLDILKVRILTSIIWLNMAPLHDHKLGLFLYYFGKYNLYKALNGK